MDKTHNQSPSPSYSPDLSPLSSLDHRSPPPSDLRHVSQSHPSRNNTINTNTKTHFPTNNNKSNRSSSPSSSSPDLSPFSSPPSDLRHPIKLFSPSDLRHVSQSQPSNNNNNTNNTPIIAPSADSSPSSDLCHVSPSPPPQNNDIKDTKNPIFSSKSHFPAQSAGSSPSSDLCHVSPSPPLQNNAVVFTSDLCHVSPSPRRTGVRREKAVAVRAERREKEVRKAALGVRVFGAVFCLVSLAVMAADKERGWAVDSFYRYKEFRYCISVNVVGFLYSVAQTCDIVFMICTGKYVLNHQYRFYFDFALDQILTYLLMSASSSAATRVDDWESNWGKDQFPMMASISVGLSFMSFVSLAASTLISGYALCTWSST